QGRPGGVGPEAIVWLCVVSTRGRDRVPDAGDPLDRPGHLLDRAGGRSRFPRAKAVVGHDIVRARGRTGAAAEGDVRVAAVILPHEIDLVGRLDAEERPNLGPLQSIDINLECAVDAVPRWEIRQRALPELERLSGRRSVTAAEDLARDGLAPAGSHDVAKNRDRGDERSFQ